MMQCKALVYLEKNEGISQAKLAELTGMETDHLLERRADPADRRTRGSNASPEKPALPGKNPAAG